MTEDHQQTASVSAVEEALSRELARGDENIASSRPILRHLLANQEQHLFSDEVIARVRGTLTHVARQLLFAQAEASGSANPCVFADERDESLSQLLFEDTAFLGHAHALTVEAQTAELLRGRSGIDSVLSPLLQELAASKDEDSAALSMRVLAAQARFRQQQRRMHLPLNELPADLFFKSLQYLRKLEGDESELTTAEKSLRATYDEGESRLGLITRLIMSMGRKAQRALAIDHGGLAIFSTALAMASDQDRDLVMLSFGQNQFVRLAISLCAAGMRKQEVEEQFMYIHPDIALPQGFELLTQQKAAIILTSTQSELSA